MVDWNFGYGMDPFIENNCSVSDCYITNDRYVVTKNYFRWQRWCLRYLICAGVFSPLWLTLTLSSSMLGTWGRPVLRWVVKTTFYVSFSMLGTWGWPVLRWVVKATFDAMLFHARDIRMTSVKVSSNDDLLTLSSSIPGTWGWPVLRWVEKTTFDVSSSMFGTWGRPVYRAKLKKTPFVQDFLLQILKPHFLPIQVPSQQRRRAFQRYVFFCSECPLHDGLDFGNPRYELGP